MPSQRDYSAWHATEDRREELGCDRLFLRPPSPSADRLDALAAKLGTNRSLAAAFAFAMALDALEGATAKDLEKARRLIYALDGKKRR